MKPLFIKKMVSVNGVCSNYGFCPDCASKLDSTMCSECCQALDDNVGFFPVSHRSLSTKTVPMCMLTAVPLRAHESPVPTNSFSDN